MSAGATECPFGPQAFRRELEDGFGRLGELRRELQGYLTARGVPADVAADVVLAVHEAAKNSMRAGAGQPVQVAVRVRRKVVCVSVWDCGPGLTAGVSRGCPSAWSTHGRGLFLMSSVMDSMAVDCAHGTCVYMRRRPTRQSA